MSAVWVKLNTFEPVVGRCSVKKVSLNVLQNSQGNTCARASFLIRLQAWGVRPATILKKRLVQVFSYEFCGIFKNTYFYRTPPMAASDAYLAPDGLLFIIYIVIDGILAYFHVRFQHMRGNAQLFIHTYL